MEMPQTPEGNEKESEFKQFERVIAAVSPYPEELKSLIPDIEKSTDLSDDEKTLLLHSIRVLGGGEGYYTDNLPSTYGNKEDEEGLELGEEFSTYFRKIGNIKNNPLEYRELDKEIEASETLNIREKNKLRGTIKYLLS